MNDRRYCARLVAGTAAVLAVLVLGGAVAAQATGRFDDVPAEHTFRADVEWMADAGITRGCDGDSFCPDDYVTRAQMAAFLRRFDAYLQNGRRTPTTTLATTDRGGGR